MTNTETTKAPVAKVSKPRAKRRTFKEVREGQHAYYEPKLRELAEEINLMQGVLHEQRETLRAVRGSWITALRYWAKGHV